jgi:hypothetical protein
VIEIWRDYFAFAGFVAQPFFAVRVGALVQTVV